MKGYIKWTVYRCKVCYWARVLSKMSFFDLWDYSLSFKDYYDENGSNLAEDDVREEMTYWGD